jgi:thiol-disulfide isomerase/thioredoxin
MKNSFSLVMFTIFIVLFLSDSAYSQIARVEPAQPRWGQTVTIIYDPKAEGAKFKPTDEVYLNLYLGYYDAAQTVFAKMNKAGEQFKYELALKENLSNLQCFFYTMADGSDNKATLRAPVYHADGQPARGVRLLKANKENYQRLFDEEMQAYPENYAVYRTKWFYASRLDRSHITEIVTADLEKLHREVKTESPGLLYALSYGHLLLKQEEQSRAALKKLVAQYPEDKRTGEALWDYSYQAFGLNLKGDGPEEVKRMQLEFIRKYPAYAFARDLLDLFDWSKDSPLPVIEAVYQAWSRDKPLNPKPHYFLAQAYLTHKTNYAQAAAAAEKALELYFAGKNDPPRALNSDWATFDLASAYRALAEASLETGRYSVALAAIKAAAALYEKTEPSFHEIEARIWQKLTDRKRVEQAWLQAWRAGSKIAESELKALYEKKNGNVEGFENYLYGKRETGGAAKKTALAFSGTALSGKQYDSAALRGKVVVLNFWFIGCAPCKAEMPGLNQLVAEFKGQGVIFLAFARDPAEDLRDFLQKTAFNYELIPDAGKLMEEQFKIASYPTHIIVDRAGVVEATMTGGNEKRHEDIRPLITRLLKSN